MESTETTEAIDSSSEPIDSLNATRLKLARDPTSTLGRLTQQTLEMYSLLVVKIQRLVTWLDECPIGLGQQESEAYMSFFQKVMSLAEEIEALASNVGLKTPYFSSNAYGGKRLSRAVYTYTNFLQWLGLPRSSWLKFPGTSFGDIAVLKLPDELILLQEEVRSIFDKWTRIGELRQSICAPEDFKLLIRRYEPGRVAALKSDSSFQKVVVRASESQSTPDDLERLLYEITTCSVVHASGFRPELTHAAAALVLLEAAAEILGGYNMEHFSFDSRLGQLFI